MTTRNIIGLDYLRSLQKPMLERSVENMKILINEALQEVVTPDVDLESPIHIVVGAHFLPAVVTEVKAAIELAGWRIISYNLLNEDRRSDSHSFVISWVGNDKFEDVSHELVPFAADSGAGASESESTLLTTEIEYRAGVVTVVQRTDPDVHIVRTQACGFYEFSDDVVILELATAKYLVIERRPEPVYLQYTVMTSDELHATVYRAVSKYCDDDIERMVICLTKMGVFDVDQPSQPTPVPSAVSVEQVYSLATDWDSYITDGYEYDGDIYLQYHDRKCLLQFCDNGTAAAVYSIGGSILDVVPDGVDLTQIQLFDSNGPTDVKADTFRRVNSIIVKANIGYED